MADRSLIHIIVSPVVGRSVVPLADQILGRILHVSVMEARDEVGAPDDIVRIEEPKRALLVTGDKLDAVQALRFPPRPMFLVDLEPTDPKNVHVCQLRHGWVQNLDPVDPEDPGVHVWMGRVAVRESHHVWTAPRVDLVHPSSEVVCGVIHADRPALLKVVASDEDLVTVIVREGSGFRIILAVMDASEEVVHQFRDKILVERSARCATEMRGNTCVQSWVIHIFAERPSVKP